MPEFVLAHRVYIAVFPLRCLAARNGTLWAAKLFGPVCAFRQDVAATSISTFSQNKDPQYCGFKGLDTFSGTKVFTSAYHLPF